jgi:hypothetical protein
VSEMGEETGGSWRRSPKKNALEGGPTRVKQVLSTYLSRIYLQYQLISESESPRSFLFHFSSGHAPSTFTSSLHRELFGHVRNLAMKRIFRCLVRSQLQVTNA